MNKSILVFLIIILTNGYATIAQAGGDKNKKTNEKTTKPAARNTYEYKKKGNCASFELSSAAASSILKIDPNDTVTIPADFPAPPPGSQACGCIKYLNTAYYVSPLTEIEIFDYYKKILVENGYLWDTPKAGAADKQYMMVFYKEGIDGHIYVHGDKGGFAVMYKPRKPCSCEKNRKKKVGEGGATNNPEAVN